MLLYDSVTSQLLTQIQSNPITYHRTAAVSAIAFKHLTPKDANNQVVAVIGSGSQARSHIRYLTTVK